MRMPLTAGSALSAAARRGGLDEVAVDQLGVAPGELGRRARGDHLAHVAELLGEAGVVAARGLPVGPRPGEAVVGLAADQQHVGGVVVLADGAAHVLVEVREVPVRVDLGDAVGRDEQGGDELRHGGDPFRAGGFGR